MQAGVSGVGSDFISKTIEYSQRSVIRTFEINAATTLPHEVV